ncbi:hypothetical protein GA0115259_1055014 [Streptomyces sp. MnatMP-M17]|nr:hypothetical protein GA0115259_1055014 [Streptomyces sp. MnatMP-M17]
MVSNDPNTRAATLHVKSDSLLKEAAVRSVEADRGVLSHATRRAYTESQRDLARLV